MIVLKCSKCKEQLEVDDAFAGGVCRCVHCGALSQVPLQPTRLDHKGRPMAPPPMAQPVIAPPAGQQHLQIAPSRAYVASRKRMGLLAVIMMLAALGMVVVVVLLAKDAFKSQDGKPGGDSDSGSSSPSQEEANPLAKPPSGPAFVNLPLPAGDIAYLLNDGSSMNEVSNAATVAIELSARRAAGRNFVVIPWVAGNESPEGELSVYPQTALAKGGADTAALRQWFGQTNSSQAREPALAAKEAVNRGASVLLLIVRNEDKEVVESLLAATAGKKVTWLAAVIDKSPADPASYEDLVRLTGDVKRVTTVRASDVEEWMRQMQSE
jgi:hypothetical protein